MSELIEIELGDFFAQRHEKFTEDLGEQYEARIRKLLEDEIHTVTQEIERQSEQQQAQLEGDELGVEADE